MARIQGDNESGKLGNKIYYNWHGRQCERAMPTHVANPKTEAQQAHRSNFAQISKLSSYMKEAHLVGFHWHAVREKNSTYALFRKINKDCFTPDGEIDYERLVVSKGSLAQAYIKSATVADGVLSVSFDGRTYGDNGGDEFFLFVYSPTHSAGLLAEPVRRSVGKIALKLPTEWLYSEPSPDALTQSSINTIQLHLYAFLRGRRLRTSDSIHKRLEI